MRSAGAWTRGDADFRARGGHSRFRPRGSSRINHSGGRAERGSSRNDHRIGYCERGIGSGRIDYRGGQTEREAGRTERDALRWRRVDRSCAGQPVEDAASLPGQRLVHPAVDRRRRADLGRRRRRRCPAGLRLGHARLPSSHGRPDAPRLQRRENVYLHPPRRPHMERWLAADRRRLPVRLRAGRPRRQPLRPVRPAPGHRHVPHPRQTDRRGRAQRRQATRSGAGHREHHQSRPQKGVERPGVERCGLQS